MDALKLICRIKQPKDQIVLIICEQDNINTVKVSEKCMYELESVDAHDNVRTEILKSEHGKKSCDIIREALTKWTEDKYIDFIYVGNKGADFSNRDEKKYLGSVTNEIIRHTKLNCIFVP